MALAAYYDDSGSSPDSKDFCLGGIVIPHAKLQLLSIEWVRICHSYPRIEYFKMADAYSGHGEFEAIPRELRMEKIFNLALLLNRYLEFGSYVYMPHDVYQMMAKEYVEERLRVHAYQAMLPHLCCLSMNQARNAKLAGPIHFLLDEQKGQEGLASDIYSSIKRANTTGPLGEYFGEFGYDDDKLVAPLQAADLLIWHARRMITHPDEFHAPYMLFAKGRVMGMSFSGKNILAMGIRHAANRMAESIFGPGRLVYPGDEGYDEAVELQRKLDANMEEHFAAADEIRRRRLESEQ